MKNYFPPGAKRERNISLAADEFIIRERDDKFLMGATICITMSVLKPKNKTAGKVLHAPRQLFAGLKTPMRKYFTFAAANFGRLFIPTPLCPFLFRTSDNNGPIILA
jgi:hypothetical protein